MSGNQRVNLLVVGLRAEAKDVVVLDLANPDGGILPPFSPGSHLEVHLSNGVIRHYSLCSDPADRQKYSIGVGLARESRGGSRHIHEQIKVGSLLSVTAPRNNFPFEENASESVFVAGGIGITPIMAMIRHCMASGRKWRLIYCARNRQRAAFYEELQALPGGHIDYHFDDERGGQLFNADTALTSMPAAAHIYCCGPAPLMTAVQSATASRPADHVHFEWFSAKADAALPAEEQKEFTVLIRSDSQRIQIPPGRSILEVLEDRGYAIPYSCREGLCRTCETSVCSGQPEHFDSVLTGPEKESGKVMLICVSRAKSDVLELDL